jgi:hypothetical protein
VRNRCQPRASDHRLSARTRCADEVLNLPRSSIPLPCVYYFFLAVVVIRYETTAAARWALLFIVRAFFNDTITVALRTGFHMYSSWGYYHSRDYGRRAIPSSKSAA